MRFKRYGIFVLMLVFFICFPSFASPVEKDNQGWLTVNAQISDDLKVVDIKYIWVILNKSGFNHVIELLPENSFQYKGIFEAGEYSVVDVSIITNFEIEYTVNKPDLVILSPDKMATLLIGIEGKEIFSPDSMQVDKDIDLDLDANTQNSVNPTSTPLDTSSAMMQEGWSFSGIITIIIFLVLCIVMLYLKFRRENIYD